MTEEKVCVLPVIDGMASFMTGNVEIQVKERIVRCRDCQYGYQHDCKRYPKDKRYMGKWYCIVWGDGMQGEWTRPDGFCHRGKQREEQ